MDDWKPLDYSKWYGLTRSRNPISPPIDFFSTRNTFPQPQLHVFMFCSKFRGVHNYLWLDESLGTHMCTCHVGLLIMVPFHHNGHGYGVCMYVDSRAHKSYGSSCDGSIPSRWAWPWPWSMYACMGTRVCTKSYALFVMYRIPSRWAWPWRHVCMYVAATGAAAD